MKKPFFNTLLVLVIALFWGCNNDTQWEGQKPAQRVPTDTRPIQKEWRGIFNIGSGLYASNDFAGARLSGIALSNDTLITALINPENTPVNSSPWYAFKLWSESEKEIYLKLTYMDGAFNRYYPKLSHDGRSWAKLDEEDYIEGKPLEGGERVRPKDITMHLLLGPDTLWVSAQELYTSSENKTWIEELTKSPWVSYSEIGQSRENRPIYAMKIGDTDNNKMIFVLSRQHPPEVTGYLAMKAFVESVTSESELASAFRKEFTTYVVPMANPDGVDNGNWRHNSGGIDLNRDWDNVNQPEVASIQNFMSNLTSTSDAKFYFAVDFHSTWEDIYYTMPTELEGNMPGLVPDMIKGMAGELGLDPNIRPGKIDSLHITSSRYFFDVHGAESLTYEIGDNTPRDLLKRKGEVSAIKLMELLLERTANQEN